MQLALDHKGKESPFNLDQAQYSAEVKSEEILRRAKHREGKFILGFYMPLFCILEDSFNPSFAPITQFGK